GSVLFHEMQYWCAKGYAVLFCNPTGGDGRGSAFADIRGRYGTIDYQDIMGFVDECLKRYDFIDPDRLGVTGGSYGGYMTNWIIGHTDRFRAAATQRGIANWVGFNFTSDIGYTFGEDQMQGTIWTEHDRIWEASPLKHIHNAKTPTLVLHSEQDYRCNMFEGFQIFSALRRLGVDTRMCLFKGENHELSRSGKPTNRIKRLEEITAWMDAYLK
ncbi:MAG TPA: prolyl oligopeptidase family serine peptidase, partial [Clostridia bacterium]|nr:prolyl oligopeptidase family serine peptidase [Clostridia bacterium]